MNLFKVAWKNLINEPSQLFLNLILFGLGVGLSLFLLLVNDQIKKSIDNNLKGIDMVIGAKGSDLQMIFSSMYHIDNPTGNIKIDDAKAFLKEGHPLIKKSVPLSIGDNYKGFRIVGTDHTILGLYETDLADGDLFSASGTVTIGHSVAKASGLKIGDHFKSSHGLAEAEGLDHEHDLKVVGVLAPSGNVLDNLILTSTYTVWDVHETPGQAEHKNHKDHIESDEHNHEDHNHEDHNHEDHNHEDHNHEHHGHNHEHVDLSRDHLLTHTDRELTNVLIQFKNKMNYQALNLPNNIKKHTPMHAVAPSYAMTVFYDRMGIGFNLIAWVAILISVISCISIGIALYNALRATKYQLAILRVQGATRKNLLFLILLEGWLIAIVGYLFGVFMAYLGYVITSGFVETKYQYIWESFPFHPAVPIFAIVSLLIGLIASGIPALQAYRLDIHHTLSK